MVTVTFSVKSERFTVLCSLEMDHIKIAYNFSLFPGGFLSFKLFFVYSGVILVFIVVFGGGGNRGVILVLFGKK
jgi:hypothetical protein